MRSIDDRDVGKEIGKKGLKKLREFRDWFFRESGGRPPRLEFRTAPSIITRSEAELFGLSSPRFAFRARMEGAGFVNARRLVKFSRSAAQHYAGTSPWSWLPGSRPKLTPREIRRLVVEPGLCIADSLLKLPPRLRGEDYQVLGCDLGLAYGEGEELWGTPFLQHIELGGGMCAQACCFMVLCLYQQWAETISGIAEITSMARADGTSDVAESIVRDGLRLNGLRGSEIVTFFRSQDVKLWSCREIVIDTGREHEFLEAAIRGYVMSDVPLILPVDLGRMWGDFPGRRRGSLMDKNNVPIRPRRNVKFKRQDHTVVLVGCQKTNEPKYLLNDPASYPFLEATLDDLLRIRRYPDSRSYANGAKTWVPSDADHRPAELISVTRRGVTLPLLDRVYDSSTLQPDLGLFSRALAAQAAGSHPAGTVLPRYKHLRQQLRNIRLIDLRAPSADVAEKLSSLPEEERGQIVACLGSLAKQWYWVQIISGRDLDNRTGASVWIWDAEMEPVHTAAWLPFLVAVLTRDATSHRWHSPYIYRPGRQHAAPAGDGAVESGPSHTSDPHAVGEGGGRAASGPLRPSLITSFDTGDRICDDREPLPPFEPACYRPPLTSPVECEWYAMMEMEVLRRVRSWRADGFFNRMRLWFRRLFPPGSAVEFLARLREHELPAVAEHVAGRFRRTGSNVVAIASFIPEISRAPKSSAARRAVAAVRNLVLLARQFQDLKHPCRTVELVAGSLCKGIHKRPAAGEEEQYIAEFDGRDECRDHLRANLEACLNKIPHDADRPVYLALELEPGPYFVLKDLASLERMAGFLDGPQLSRWVGFNLDVAHWRLAHILPDDALRSDAVLERVVHAHLAGHHRCAHFGDIRPFDLNTRQDFEPWIKLLKGFRGRADGRLQFSGHVSLELEAAKSDEYVQSGLRDMLTLL